MRFGIIAVVVVSAILILCRNLCFAETESVYMANGIKVGEVTSHSAIVWTRLTKQPERNLDGIEFGGKRKQIPDGHTLDEMEGSVPGEAGEVGAVYWPTGEAEERKSVSWKSVDPESDYTQQIQLTNLNAGTEYEIKVMGRTKDSDQVSCMIEGTFKTAPAPDINAPVCFTVVTCQRYQNRDDPENGHMIYPQMLRLDPDFFVHTGDIEYYDKDGPYSTSLELARFKWNRIYAMPFQRDFHRQVTSYFMKDDHDTVKNDCWPGQKYGDLTWAQGLSVFCEQVPMGEKTYRTFRWGKDLQIWLVEGRDFRSPNNAPDGPDKTIWGKNQKEWFFKTVKESDATFRILISPTPIVGPDRPWRSDNYSNRGFSREGNEIRNFIAGQKNMYIICGDRHWQYVSVDQKTGVREYCCGPTSDKHAYGYLKLFRRSMHRYLEIKGGFLSVTIAPQNDEPKITFRHHAVDGSLRNEDVFQANW